MTASSREKLEEGIFWWHLSFPAWNNCGALSEVGEPVGMELVTCNVRHTEGYSHRGGEIKAQRGVVIYRFNCTEPTFLLLSPTAPSLLSETPAWIFAAGLPLISVSQDTGLA